MIDEAAARDILAVADASLAAASRYIGELEDGDVKNAIQRLFDAVNTHQLFLRGHVEGHPG